MKLFKIVAIVDTSTVIINGGSQDDITLKSQFDILEDQPIQIKDPDSKEILGEFKQKKQRIYAKEVHERYTICTSKYTVVKQTRPLAAAILNQVQTPDTFDFVSGRKIKKTVGRDMKIDKNEVNDVLNPYSYSTIHVNDKVELITE